MMGNKEESTPPQVEQNDNDDTPKETDLQKQMRLGWNQDDDKDMDSLASDTLKRQKVVSDADAHIMAIAKSS